MRRISRATFAALIAMAVLPAAASAGVTPTGAPSISGTATVGQTLTCSGATFTSNDGGTPTPQDYFFYYSTDLVNPIAETFSGTINTYKLVAADVGKQIVCVQSDVDGGSGDFSTANSAPSTPTSAVVAGPAPGVTGVPTVSNAAEVGGSLFCDSSGVNFTPAGDGSDFVDQSFQWVYSGTTTPAANTAELNSTDYSPVAADLGHQLVCKVIGTDAETAGTASASSAATAPVAPEPSVTITQFSPAVSGGIGESVAGVAVTVTLKRPAIGGGFLTVGQGTANTDGTGLWSTSITPNGGGSDAFGGPNDRLIVSYAQGVAPGGTILPATGTYDNNGSGSGDVPFDTSAAISSGGTTVFGDTAGGGDCPDVKFIIDGTSHGTTLGANGCQYSPSSALTDSNSVQAEQTATVSDNSGDASLVTAINNVGLLGVPAYDGAPACSADYVFGDITCTNLNGGSFSVTVTGASPVALSTTTMGDGSYFGSATVTGLAAGKTVTLNEGSVSRALTVLHLSTLRVDEGVQTSPSPAGISFANGGSCTPFKIIDSGAACPAGGTMPYFMGTHELDDQSGGSTLVDVPALGDLVPQVDDSMVGAWTAFGDVLSDHKISQAAAATASVAFSIVPHGGTSPTVSATMTPESDGDSAFESHTLSSALSAGRYFADFVLTDTHGDTVSYSDLFAQQPGGATGATGPTGPAGPTGAVGPQGPQGPQGKTELVKCTTTIIRKGTKKKKKTVCKVSQLSVGTHVVSIALSRGHRTYATGTASVRGSIARVRLHAVRRLRHGRYRMTVIASRNGKASVRRFIVRL